METVSGLDRGARYFRADLQVHTPVDKNWIGPRPTHEAERPGLATAYLRAAKERGVELIGITEHHDVSWIDALRHAARGLGMSLLPGFEVESKEGVHLLCLFDPKVKVVDLEDVLAKLGLDGVRRRSNVLTEISSQMSFAEVVRLVQDQCFGICIAAHVTSRKGLLETLEGRARADAWKTPELLAAQISPAVEHEGEQRILDNEDPKFRRERPLAYILTSDARSLEAIGTQSVWIKMHQPGVEGLRQAFLDPGSRISQVDPAAPRAEILTLAWEGGFLDGQSIGVSSELTCLIGGKGTGKSTVIESIRWAFGLEPPEDSDAARLREQIVKGGSKIVVTVMTAAPAIEHRVERTGSSAPVVRDRFGSLLPDVTPRDLITPLIYSQKQLYETAQSTEGRLELVDVFAGDRLHDARAAERALLAALRDGGQALRLERQRLDEWEEQLGALPGLEEWRKRFETAGFKDRLAERTALDREQSRLEALDEALLGRLRALERAVVDVAPPPVQQRSVASPNHDLIERAESVVIPATSEFASGLDLLREALVGAREALGEVRAEWAARRAARQAEFDAALRELQKTMPDVDPERYLDVERRIEALLPVQDELDRAVERLRAARQARDAMLIDLEDVRARKHRLRSAAADELTAATGHDVRVRVEYQADRSKVLDALRRLKTGARSAAIEAMVADSDFSPAELARRVRERRLAGSFGLPDGQAASLERILVEDDLLGLEVIELCDQVTVELDLGPDGTRDYRALDGLSPGQKSTAILLLTLRSGADPLLIDQPEDDLDNRFVYDDVVQRLRDAKRSRQVIVATHNANIPVLGDAEQIIVLDAVSGPSQRGEVTAHGPIDDRAVRTSVEHILEGGQQAFRKRREKYGW